MIGMVFMMAAMVAAPVSDQSEFDMQIMVGNFSLPPSNSRERRPLATQMAAMYYFGRVDGAFPDAVLEERLASVAKAIEGRPLGLLLEQCGAFIVRAWRGYVEDWRPSRCA